MLSLAMIIKNEEHNLHRCLSSVWNLVDEMVIVDTGSTDDSMGMARALDAHVFQFEWCDDYSAARNFALSKCTGDWVLILDGDEALYPEDHELIRACMANDRYDIYTHPLRHFYHDGRAVALDEPVVRCTSGEYPYCSDATNRRLVRNLPGLHWTGRLHEMISLRAGDHDLRMGEAKFRVYHYGRLDRENEARKRGFYLDIAMKEYGEDPKNPKALFNFLTQARAAEAWDKMLEASEIYLGLGGLVPAIVATMVGEAMHHAGRYDAALQCFRLVLLKTPGNVFALNRVAITLIRLGRINEARRFLYESTIKEPAFTCSHLVWAEMEASIGDVPMAKEILKQGITDNPTDTKLADALAKLEAEDGRVQGTLRGGTCEADCTEAGPAGPSAHGDQADRVHQAGISGAEVGADGTGSPVGDQGCAGQDRELPA